MPKPNSMRSRISAQHFTLDSRWRNKGRGYQTIGFLAKAQHATVFTSYNVSEARGETVILVRMGANFLWEPESQQLEGNGAFR
jgi:hypothetical protein